MYTHIDLSINLNAQKPKADFKYKQINEKINFVWTVCEHEFG